MASITIPAQSKDHPHLRPPVIEGLLRQVPGTRSAIAERGVSGLYVDVEADRGAAARYGLNIQDVNHALMTAVGGALATQTVEGRERYGVLVRYPRELRQGLEGLGQLLVSTPTGAQVPLAQIATVRASQGPMVIKTENAFPVSAVFIDVEGRDIGRYVDEASALLAQHLQLPPGYTLRWSGQYEAMQRVRERMRLIVPLTLLLVFVLLFLHFRNATQTLMVMSTLPLALVGGVWLVWLLGYDTSVAVWVGFIALAGVAAEIGVERYLILESRKTQSPDVGTHTLMETVFWTRSEMARRTLGQGTAVVRMAQPLAHVAIYLLEPESDDGLARRRPRRVPAAADRR